MAKEKKTVEPDEGETKLVSNDPEYVFWLQSVKARLRSAQLKASVAVNREMLQFYWDLGADIVQKQAATRWGEGFIKQLSADLTAEFANTRGFSVSNIKNLRQWYQFYASADSIGQQAVGQLCTAPLEILFQVPWGHHLVSEYSLSGIGKPMGVSEYQLTHALPENLKSSLPSIEEIESELGADA